MITPYAVSCDRSLSTSPGSNRKPDVFREYRKRPVA